MDLSFTTTCPSGHISHPVNDFQIFSSIQLRQSLDHLAYTRGLSILWNFHIQMGPCITIAFNWLLLQHGFAAISHMEPCATHDVLHYRDLRLPSNWNIGVILHDFTTIWFCSCYMKSGPASMELWVTPYDVLHYRDLRLPLNWNTVVL